MDPESDKKEFEGLILEEPSLQVDRNILAQARGELARRRRRDRWMLAVRCCAAASLLVLAPAVFLGPWRTGFSAGGQPSSRVQHEVRDAIVGLRSDLSDINEMSEMIVPERRSEREEILAKVRECFSELDKLERRLDRDYDSSFLPSPSWRKKENA